MKEEDEAREVAAARAASISSSRVQTPHTHRATQKALGFLGFLGFYVFLYPIELFLFVSYSRVETY